jgi:hypothetical protein
MHSRRYKHPRFVNAGNRANKDDTSIPQRPHPVRRSPEMEAHHLWLVGQEGGKHVIILDEAPVDLCQGCWRLTAQSSEFGTQSLDPGGFDGGIRFRRLMTEDVDIFRAPAAFVAPTPIEPKAPAFATAAAMAGDDTPAMGAWMIGSSTPSKSSSVCGETGMVALLS